MKVLVSAFALLATAAMAQGQIPTPSLPQSPPLAIQPILPKTVPLTNKDNEIIGTATFAGNRIFLRDTKGELFVWIVVEKDGTKTMYDAHGKVLDRIEPPK